MGAPEMVLTDDTLPGASAANELAAGGRRVLVAGPEPTRRSPARSCPPTCARSR